MGQQADPRPPDPGLDDDAIRAFTMGFLDGLRDREAVVRDDPPTPTTGTVMTSMVWMAGVILQML